ncbi:T9SS type B sorting domain-containing protein [Gaetbulibacter aquiaggeris]|uniref:T9SS type B sorting domain-containing protein n=1 Tax=Gaetbulibacter aquiaggeris TaxID=1735373 RepID=A0ABW7MU64_9FLAO
MKKTTSAKLALIALIIFACLESYAQTYKPFSVRNKIDVKGSMLVIGNNILGKDNLPFNDDTKDNQDISMQYIDIDTDASTFSSSSADLLIPPQKNGSPTTCYRVSYAALYWGAMLQSGSRADINKVKIKLPGSTVYNDITGEVIYDAIANPIVSLPNEPGNTPYACYADVTSLLSGVSNLEGTFTVANVRSSLGLNATTGLSAGWTLYVIYEDPNLTTKSFSSFDGFAHLSSGRVQTIPISGFNTPQSGPVDFQIAYAAFDTDKNKKANKLEINNKEITTPLRPTNNFFGSVIENGNGITFPRNPFGSNTLGYDTGFLDVYSGNPAYIKNNATSAELAIQVARGQADPIFFFFSAFAVDIIAPDINLTKIVLDTAGNNIDGADVTLGQNLFYKISYQSVGNDNVTQFTIKDVLPDNVIFDPLTDIDLSSSGGATLQSYDPITRTLIFNIPNSSVEINDPIFEIRIAVKIVSECYALSQACSNEIRNQAFATYSGLINPTIIQDEGSFDSVTCLGTPAPTNFLVDISNCTFAKNEVLCGSSVVLTAADGYDTYSWSTSPTGTPVIGTEQTYTATSTGTYYVQNTTLSTCISIQEEITVVPYGNTITNPVIPFADSNPICPNDGKVLPNIFLCGANATRSINTGISDASSIIWEKLDENSCAASTVDNCANENDTCIWNQVGSGPNYLSNTAGQFRVVINYTGGCFSIFYFNVYQNLLNPTATAKDIICNTPGEITVGGVPGGYEYSIDGINYQAGNVFTVNTPNYYIIYIRQIGVDTNPCIFETPRVYVRNRNFTVSTFVTQPYCNGGQGTIKLAANDALPQYYYSLFQGGTLINSVGPITASDYTFANLNPGIYNYTVSTDDGCSSSGNIELINPPLLTATAALTKPLTCTDGEITVFPVGGTPPYVYDLNSASVYQNSPIFTVPTAGVYNITVVDFNNCTTTVSIPVNATPAPVFNTAKVDVLCANSGNTGSISVNVTNANGNSLRYSIDNGATFVNSPIFNGLAAGTYDVVLEYTIGSDVCLTTPQTITINPTAPIIGTATLTTPYTCITNGTITISGVSGGNGPYAYSIDGVTFQPGNTFSGLTNGNYTATIRDVNGCTVNTNTIIIAPLNPPTDLSFSNSPLTCPTNLSVVTINSTTGGVGTLEYRIVSPVASATAYQASTSFAGLAPGTYTFEVKDANDCTYSEPYTIVPLPALTVVGQKINDITCFGASDGAARFTVSGSTGFTYTINGGASIAGSSPINLTGLAAATYTVVITDTTTNCQATASVTIDSPATALSLTTTVTPLTCNANGSVVINAIGGWGGNSYTLTQPDTTILPAQGSNTFSNLSQPGTYAATVTDSKGCVQIVTFSLSTPTAPTASIAIVSDYCFDPINGATLEVTAAGGITPYEYNINGGPFGSSNIFANLTPGNYTIIVRDAYGCIVTLPAQTIAPQLTVNTVLTKELDCSASPDAVITGTITGGYSPFTYAISINGGAYSSLGATGSPFVYTTFTDGTYQFQITDARGCQSESNVITISPLTNPIVTGTTTQVSCNGVSDGSVQLVGSGGSGGYTYSDDNVTFVGTSLFTGLAAGSHTFYIRDSKNCSSSVTVVITEPTVLVATASATAFSCSATNTKQSAVITIAVPTTGTAPYQYSFNGGATFSSSNTLTVNDNGSDQTFTYVVRDANGCLTALQNITLTALNPPTDLAFASTAVTCLATASTVTLTATNGVGPLEYETIAPSPIIVGKQGSNVFTGLTPGTYVFRVTDANGCYYTESYIVAPVTPITVTGLKLSDVLCFGDNTGAIQYTVSGYAGTYTSTLTSGAGTLVQAGNTINVTNLIADTYTIEVTDDITGCTANATIIITEPAVGLTFTATSTNVYCSEDNSQITVNPLGGTASYTYAAVVTGSAAPAPGAYASSSVITVDTNSATDLVWDVYVKDANGCITMNPVTIIADALPTVTTPPLASNQCTVTTGFTFTATGTGLVPLSYSINGGASYQASPTFTVNVPGTYFVTIKDKNGCTAISPTATIVYAPLTSLAAVTKELDCSASPDAVITVTISGGNAPFTYTVQKGAGAPSAPSAPIAGPTFTYSVSLANVDSYTFVITDTNGCTSTSTITIDPITNPIVTGTTTQVSCNGVSDGSVQLVGSGGSGGYTYSDDNVTFVGTSLFTGLAAGSHTFYIRDSKNCSSSVTVVITEPTVLVATASATAFSCSATNTKQSAVITIAVPTTGTAPYQYSFNGGATFSSSNTLTVNDNGSDQTFTYVVRDANGCLTALQNITLTALNPPTDLAFASTAVTCLATASTVTLTATNGVGPLEYETIAPSPIIVGKQGSNVFTGLTPGTYVFRVTDANGCYYTESYIVAPVTPITVTGLKLSDVLCFGDNTGAIQYTVSGYAGTYTSTLTSGAGTLVQAGNTINVTNLIADTYTIEVTDDITGCTANATIIITEPAVGLTFTATSTNVYCSEDNSQITVNPLGGTASYTYAAVVTGSAAPAPGAYASSSVITVDTNSATDLVWDVYVKDANGCITMNPVTIIADALPTVTTPPLASNQCTVTTGFTFTATGTGLVPLSYSINGGASYQASPTFTVNVPGTYFVTIKDKNGCTAISPTATIVYVPLDASALLTKDLTCSVPTTAAIDVTAFGGNAPYTYRVKIGAGAYGVSTPMIGASFTYNAAAADTYQFEITDANGCTKETNVITTNAIVNPDIINVIEIQPIACNGEATAAIQIIIDPTKGLGPFLFNVFNTTTAQNYGSQTSGLTAGDYIIRVTDAKGCIDTFPITISEPTTINVLYHADPVTCIGPGLSQGAIIIDGVTGGTAPYNYFVSSSNGYSNSELNATGSTSFAFNVVDFGLYEILVVDANGCSFLIQNVLVASPPNDLDITVISPPADCSTGGSATVKIGAPLAGSGPYHFAIYTGPGMTYVGPTAFPWQDESFVGSEETTFINLIPGASYTFIVYDELTDCYYYETSTVPVPTNSTLVTSASSSNNITCTGSSDGNISFDITSSYLATTDVTYEIFDSLSLVTTGITGSGTVPASGTLTVSNLGPLPTGNYIVVVTEDVGATNAGCSVVTSPVNITESAFILALTASVSRNENCNELGVITAIGQDGTAPYEYQVVPTGGPIVPANWASANSFSLTGGNYDIYVRDAYGCIQSVLNLQLPTDPLPTIDPIAPQCFTGSPISITLVEGTGTAIAPLTYSIGGAYQAGDTFTISAAGSYTVSIKDGNGCIVSTTYDVQPPLLLDANMTQDLTCTVDASITLTASGGTGVYTIYEVDYNSGGYGAIAGLPYTATLEGTYQFRVTDSQGCQSESNIIIVTPKTAPTLTYTQTNVSCNGGADGSIVVTAADGIAPYQYSINGAPFVTSNVFNGLSAGLYDVVVMDSKNCVSPATTVTITEPAIVGGTIVLTQGLTCGAGNATQAAIVTVTGSGGTAPYTYSFDGGVNYTSINTYTTYSSGLVTAYVKDANGCLIPAAITFNVPALDPPTDLGFVSTAVTCLALTSDVTLTTTNGVGPLSYAIISPASATGNVTGLNTGIFTGLLPDTYVFEVTDANFCTYQESYTVVPVINITVSGTLVNDVSCNGGSNGAVDFTVSNFTGTYSYTINGGPAVVGQSAATISLTGLPIGDQIIVVTDETTGCTDTVTITVSEPTVLTLVETTNINANCNFGAQVSVTAGGGTPNYTYAFVQNLVAPIASDYTASASAVLDPAVNVNWDVWVMDANGCTTQIDIVIATDPLPTIDPIAPQCFTGSPISITLAEGTGTAIAPLTYSIGGAYQAGDTFTISAAGSYTVSIKDGNGCIVSTTYDVQPPLLLDANMTQDLTCTVDASITLTASGGTGVYTIYEVDYNSGGYGAIAGLPYTATLEGTYQFRVTDSQGCQSESNIIIVTPKTAPTLTYTQTNVSCNGGADGSIVVTAADGIAPYQYSINGAPFVTSNVFNGLSAGLYDVVVMDSKNCVSPATTVTITEPAIVGGTIVLTQGLTCGAGNATQAAIVTVTGSGGTAPYTYSFDGGVNYTSINTYTTYSSGLVTAYVKDANGCLIPAAITFNVPALDPPTDLGFVSTAVTCLALTSDVTLTTTNGVGPLSYAIISPASATGNVTGLNTGIFTGLLPDTYVFEVTDANFCTYQESYTVVPVINITVSGTLVNDVSCNGGSNGAVDFTVSNFTGTYSYTINGGPAVVGQSAATISLTGLPIGDQIIVVTDETTGCTDTVTITVSEPTVLTLVETTNINANCNFGAQVSVTAGGGTPNYTYAFVQNLVAPIASDYTASASAVLDPAVNVNWDVWVMDANGCTTQIDIVIATDPLPTVTVPALASNQCNLTGSLYTFTITGGAGIAPLTYSIGTGYQTSGTFTSLTPGTYFVTVKDGNGCTAVSPTAVTIYPPLDLTPTITALPTCADDDGIITVAPAGGSGVYTYAISPSAGSISGNVISGVPSGPYTITITDTVTGCSKDVPVTLSAATPVTFTTSVNDVSCNGGNDGIITVNLSASNDNPIYTYEITAGPIVFGPQNSNIFAGLVAGNYTVQVNSGRGCSTPAIVPVTQPALLAVSGVATEFGCAADNSVNTSTLTITEAGGTAPHTFSIDGINYLGSNIFDIIDTGLPQNIDIYVKDDNGCIAFNTVSILPLPTLTAATVGIATPIDCNNSGSVAITVTGGSGTFTYQMLPSGIAQPSNIFSVTVPGDYYFQVNDLTTGCTIATSAFTVAPFDLIDVVAAPTTAVTCFGDTDGTLEINVSGYAGPYNYEVFDILGASVLAGTGNTTLLNPQPITGLSGGNYSVLVTETASPFCATSSNVITIASPSEPLTLVATETANVTCTNDKGTITALASGGWGSYEYELTGTATVAYSANGTFTNLSAGNYTVNTRDAGGCIVSQNVTLVIPAPINATVIASTNLLSCFGDTSATITVSGVTGGEGTNYSYTLLTSLPSASASGPQASPVFSGLGAGTYNVLITDGYNCSYTSAPIVIAQPTVVQSQLVKTTSQTCLTGTTLTLSATGGTGVYSYSDNINFTGGSLGTFVSSTTITVAPGTYVYYVRDANGCVAEVSNEIKIDPLPALVVTVDATNAFINCAGDNTGVIVAEAQGGLGNYIYTLQDASGTNIPGAVQNSPGVFTDLFAGTYQVRVDSGDCFTTSAPITITEPTLPLTVSFLSTDVTCNGSNNGLLQINASGGTGTIQYAISPQLNQFFETSTFDNLAPGTYDIIVQDELGCFVYFPVTITEPSPLFLSIVTGSLIPEVCSGDMDGEFSIDITGGTEPYSVSLDDINGVYTIGILGQTQFDFTGLEGGDHVVYVRDNEGCESEWNITFPESVLINAEVEIEYCTTNTDASSNTVAVYVDNSTVDTADIDYSLDGGVYQTSSVFNDVIPGNHTIYVRHTNTCEKVISFDVEQFDALQIAIADGDLNEIVATTAGGSGIYEYELTNLTTSTTESFGSTESYFIYNSGDYTVTVTDSNGCIASATRYFEFIDVCITNYFTPNGDGYLDEWGPGCTSQYKDLTYDIFDRYGRKVANLRAGQKWDGRYNGAELPSGDYWYAIRLNDKKDNRQFVGHFTLYR